MIRLERSERISDALRVAMRLPAPFRRWAARRAAARGLADAALRAAPDDAVVLSRLGLYDEALRTRGGGREAAAARVAAAAATGRVDPAQAMQAAGGPLSDRQRRYLAACAAPFDPDWALRLLPKSDLDSRAACALAAGDLDLAQALIGAAGPCQQTLYLAGAVATWRGEWRRARRALNLAFAGDGLAPPLDAEIDAPTTLDAFGGEGLAGVDGPLISVVMSARDAASTLSGSVASILAQTWRNLELLIVDDRSTDETRSIAQALASRDLRIRVLANGGAPGAYGARNTGLRMARGMYIAFQDADDWAHPQKLERQARVLGAGKGLTLCRHFRVDGAGRALSPRVFPFIRLCLVSAMARAEAFAAIGPFDEVPTGADSEWLARFDGRFGVRAAPRTPEVGVVALWRPASLMGSAQTGLLGEGLRRRLAYVETWRHRASGREAT